MGGKTRGWCSSAAMGSLSGTLLQEWAGEASLKGGSAAGRQHGRFLAQEAKKQADTRWEKTNPQWEKTPAYFLLVPSMLSPGKTSLSSPQNWVFCPWRSSTLLTEKGGGKSLCLLRVITENLGLNCLKLELLQRRKMGRVRGDCVWLGALESVSLQTTFACPLTVLRLIHM